MKPASEGARISGSAGTWLDRLRGPENSVNNEPYLDGIRACAVIMILLRHAWGLSGEPPLTLSLPLLGTLSFAPLLTMYSTGVDLFFVLSGFLLARSFLRADFQSRPQPEARRYFLQRILRIGPPYWVALALIVFLFTPGSIPADKVYSREGLIVFLTHVVFGQMLYFRAFGSFNVARPLWTLSIEMTFYLLLPLLVRLFFRRRWMVSLPASLAIVLLWLYACRYGMDSWVAFIVHDALFAIGSPEAVRFFLSHTFPAQVFHFALGITLCNLMIRRELGWKPTRAFLMATSQRAGLIYQLLGLATVLYWQYRHGAASLIYKWGWPLNYMTTDTAQAREYYFLEGIPFAVGFGLILFGVALRPGWARRCLSFSWLCLFGVAGYSIYLLHLPLLYHVKNIPWFTLFSGSEYFFLELSIGGIATLAISLGFFLAVERPAMAAAKRAGKRREVPSTPAQSQSEGPLAPASEGKALPR